MFTVFVAHLLRRWTAMSRLYAFNPSISAGFTTSSKWVSDSMSSRVAAEFFGLAGVNHFGGSKSDDSTRSMIDSARFASSNCSRRRLTSDVAMSRSRLAFTRSAFSSSCASSVSLSLNDMLFP